MPAQFEFVPMDGPDKPQSLHRDLIRRHCMRGKNKRENSRRTLRQIRRTSRNRHKSHRDAPLAAEPSNAVVALEIFPQAEKPSDRACVEHQNAQANSPRFSTPRTTSHWQRPHSCSAGSPVSPFGTGLSSGSHGAFRDWSMFVSLKKIIYPIEPCVAFEQEDFGGMMWLSVDKSFLQTIRFSTFAMEDFLHHRPPAPATWSHLQAAIALLNERLSLGDISLQGSTVYTVALLALSASLFDDHVATQAHLLGLHKMVQILGGLHYLHDNPVLHYKLSRLELPLYLNTGYRSLSTSEVSWTSMFPLLQANGEAAYEMKLIQNLCEPKLGVIFQDLWFFTNLINEHLVHGRQMKVATFQSQIDCIQMRLLQPQLIDCDNLSESLRLGMLAFIVVTFGLPRSNTQYDYLAHQLCHSLLEIDFALSKLQKTLFWVLILGSMTGLEMDEPKLQACRTQLIGHSVSWEDARQSLRNVMWIDRIHDGPGQKAFTKLNSKRHVVE